MPKVVWDTSKIIDISSEGDVASALLSARGLSKSELKSFLQPTYPDDLQDPMSLPGIEQAVKRIEQALNKKEKIAIYGDYDIDGLTATALLFDFFTSIGADVGTFIPDRFEQGYGLNAESLLELQSTGADLIISVDCGTTAVEPLAIAKKAKLDIVVTDHHEPSKELPSGAVSIVNPKLSKTMPFIELAGVGVAFYLVRAILQKSPKLLPVGHEKWLLDLVALGTVCDVVPLEKDNRVLVHYGLKVLRKTRRIGLQALAEVAGVDIENITEADLGFKLGPRLNAAGRLEHAKKALELLTTTNKDTAIELAIALHELNTERQAMTQAIFDEADVAAKKYKKDPILILSSPDWSHGVVGIVASKLSEKWHKPVILLQEQEKRAKGSARSFNTFNIVEAIADSAELLDSFGGHAFAAGITIQPDRIEEFRYRINQYAVANMDVENNFKTIVLAADYASSFPKMEIFDNLVSLSPFGNANPEPVFRGQYKVQSMRFVGQHNNHLQLRLINSASREIMQAIAFSAQNKWTWLSEGVEAEFAFRPKKNEWQGTITVQIEIVDIKELK